MPYLPSSGGGVYRYDAKSQVNSYASGIRRRNARSTTEIDHTITGSRCRSPSLHRQSSQRPAALPHAILCAGWRYCWSGVVCTIQGRYPRKRTMVTLGSTTSLGTVDCSRCADVQRIRLEESLIEFQSYKEEIRGMEPKAKLASVDPLQPLTIEGLRSLGDRLIVTGIPFSDSLSMPFRSNAVHPCNNGDTCPVLRYRYRMAALYRGDQCIQRHHFDPSNVACDLVRLWE